MNSALLTIDDIASKNTPAIVDYLKEKGIKPIFFATGENVERYYEEALYVIKNGMIVGNHSYSHPAFSSLTWEECLEEIEKCEAVLNKLYRDGGVERVFRPFRFPYGDKGGANKDALQNYFKEKGFHKVNDTHITYPWWKEQNLNTDIDTFWTFDFAEYNIRQGSDFTKESVWKRMHNPNPETGAVLFAENNRHILLLHAHDETEELLPEYYKLFIEHLLENGLTFDAPGFLC
ncbi:MAG: polysaccharide deacetylase family protein [Lachnospiraceae bacterium]|nr:polysaccharide deacetylase family protein [Lachnospiraceae bacterium]